MVLQTRSLNTYIAQTNGCIDTLHSNNNIVKRGSNVALGEERTLDQCVALGGPLAHEMIKKAWKD
jgi:hypothetical protein